VGLWGERNAGDPAEAIIVDQQRVTDPANPSESAELSRPRSITPKRLVMAPLRVEDPELTGGAIGNHYASVLESYQPGNVKEQGRP
jgi:hypothetical protein